MPKKCIICEKNAKYSIKGTSDYYCEECAVDNFSDIGLLIKVKEEAKKLKELIEKTEIKADEAIGENQYLPDKE